MPQRNLVSWTSMITALSQNLRIKKAFKTFSAMRLAGQSPTQFSIASLVRLCVARRATGLGIQMHCLAFKHGLVWDVFVASNVADMYSRAGLVSDSCKLFEEIESKDAVLWTAMIDGYAKNEEFRSGMRAFKGMVGDGIRVDPHVLSSAFIACASTSDYEFGKCLHSSVVKLGFEFELVVSNTLVEMYSITGDMSSASKVFEIFSDPKKAVSI